MNAKHSFRDRTEAGQELAHRLEHFAGRDDLLVLGLARGGVPVAFEVARRLRAPLDVFIVRKLGVPGHEELAMGAIASGGVQVLNERVLNALHLDESSIDRVAQLELKELSRRERQYRGNKPMPNVRGKTVILIDDGLATGATMAAAVQALRKLGPAKLVVAVPVGAPETCEQFQDLADEIVCAREPADFAAVGEWYEDFQQTSDAEVHDLLAQSGNLPLQLIRGTPP